MSEKEKARVLRPLIEKAAVSLSDADAYGKGDKVWYPDKDTTVYASLVDNNVWEPTTPGLWDKQ